jgi:hypothetical protein
MSIANEDILLGKRNAVAVNTADNLDQHHDGRRTEDFADTPNQAIGIFQHLGFL